MEKTDLFNLPRLSRTLCHLVIVALVLAVVLTPVFDFSILENMPTNWTVTRSVYEFLVIAMPLLAIGLNGLSSRREKLVLRTVAAIFLYAAYITLTAATNLPYPIYGFVTFLGATLVGILFYVSAREGLITARATFVSLAIVASFVALPLLLVFWDVPRYVALAEAFGTTSIIYGYENPRAIGWLSSAGLSLAIAYSAARTCGDRLSPAMLVLTVIAATALFWSGSRAGLLALSISTCILLFVARDRNLKGSLIVVACIAIGAAFSTFLFVPSSDFGILARISETTQMGDANGISSGRLKLWQTNLSLISERPFSGYGLLPHKNIEGLAAGSSHNIVLEMWLSMGVIVGSLALLCLIWLWITLCLIARASQDRHILALFCLTTTFAVYCLMSGPYARTLPLLIFAIAAGTVLGAGAQRTRATT